MSPDEIAVQILQVASQPRSILFAGAGVSARVGMPSWAQLLEVMAETCDEFSDKGSAYLIREKTKEGDYLGAATVYRISKKIPVGVMHQRLVAPFNKFPEALPLERMEGLVGLGFSSFVTTNYDRVLHNSYAKFSGKSAIQLELDDTTLKSGSTNTDFCIARIHGRVELPESIKISQQDYDGLQQNRIYQDYLSSILRGRPCLFLGFSFLDPAIEQVLDTYEKNFSPHFDKLHIALVPESKDRRLADRLNKVNIRLIEYQATDKHSVLWNSVRLAFEKRSLNTTTPKKEADSTREYSQFKKYIAFGYAQMSSRRHQAPLIESSHEAIVLAALQDAASKGLTDEKLTAEVRHALSIDDSQAEQISVDASNRLSSQGFVERRGGLLYLTKAPPNEFEDKLIRLAGGVIDRMKVVAGYTAPASEIDTVARCIESLFMIRSWDLAPHYAGSSIGYPPDVGRTIANLVESHRGSGKLKNAGAARLAIQNLLEHPDDAEEKILSDIGRAAFAIQVIFSNPRQSAFQRFILPERIYLDSNILMPAIIEGHPLTELYFNGIKKFQDAARRLNLTCEILTLYPFVNEVISHRRNAVALVKRLGLDDPGRLEKYITLIGAHNGNVFVGAFSSAVGRLKNKLTFEAFLRKAAPYENEEQLINFLEGFGVTVVRPKVANLVHFHKITALVRSGYQKAGFSGYIEKDEVLVEHESAQLAILRRDNASGLRSVFVTADLQLTNILYSDNYLRQFSGSLLSNISFIGLVDLFIGAGAVDRSFARLIWATSRDDDQIKMREYLVQRALSEYESALAKKLPAVLESIVESSSLEREIARIRLSSVRNPEDIEKNLKFLDRYETEFFSKMREAIEKSDRKTKN